ncbi:hypothetical protein [Calidifontibacter indicus]|uniref:Uncharacterized protein n=1 Tax=Calidifontibacter indicus TaxID=419650 RepID=A0A3D9UMX2_9MICO|nr:hypothetical protein [Calidifontibacter indicus]REF30636.1 hypothetical protein DFJ65_1651 [Calidifontibacter indicus]
MSTDTTNYDLANLTAAVRAIAHGDANDPGGREALAMAVGYRGESSPTLAGAIEKAGYEIAEAIRDGLDQLARAITEGTR